MKNFLPSVIFKGTVLVIAILCVIHSCAKKETLNANCLAIIVPDTLRFKVVNKNTGEDLFFSNSPVYTTDQIHFTIPDAMVNLKPMVETLSKFGEHFTIAVAIVNASGTIKVYISNDLVYTIRYTVKKDKINGCPKYSFDKVFINDEQTEINVQGRILVLKK